VRRFELKTLLPCSANAAWEAVQRRTLLEHVTHSLLKFMPLGLEALPDRFREGTYELKLYLFGFLPLGRHTIRVVRLDPLRRELLTEESGTLVKTWNHRIILRTDAQGRTLYSDALSLDAGRLTPVVWVFAQTFYRYRQLRWRALARTLETKSLQTEVG
jgi:hypothetical protein